MKKSQAASALAHRKWAAIPKEERAEHVPRNGGAPRQYRQCPKAKYHRWNKKNRCRFCDMKRKIAK